jgi:hypothetical protein
MVIPRINCVVMRGAGGEDEVGASLND